VTKYANLGNQIERMLDKHSVDTTIWLSDLQYYLKSIYESEPLAASIQAAMSRLIKNGAPIEIVKRGQAWKKVNRLEQATEKVQAEEPKGLDGDAVANAIVGADPDRVQAYYDGLNVARAVMGDEAFMRRMAQLFAKHDIVPN
jgi:hypothetical protein